MRRHKRLPDELSKQRGHNFSPLRFSAAITASTQPAYTRIDARIGIAHSNGHWDLLLIGNNLSDEMILNNGQVFLANAGYLKTPRRISLQGTDRFSR